MTRFLPLQQYEESLLSCNASPLIVREWPYLRLTSTMMDEIDVTFDHCLLLWTRILPGKSITKKLRGVYFK